jgi:hypothetical protein
MENVRQKAIAALFAILMVGSMVAFGVSAL